MENSIDRTNYLSGTSLPFQELEEGFDDWVRELQSILQPQENPLTIPCIRKKANQKRNQRRSKIIYR
jgi:hypothetical protein